MNEKIFPFSERNPKKSCLFWITFRKSCIIQLHNFRKFKKSDSECHFVTEPSVSVREARERKSHKSIQNLTKIVIKREKNVGEGYGGASFARDARRAA